MLFAFSKLPMTAQTVPDMLLALHDSCPSQVCLPCGHVITCLMQAGIGGQTGTTARIQWPMQLLLHQFIHHQGSEFSELEKSKWHQVFCLSLRVESATVLQSDMRPETRDDSVCSRTQGFS